MKRVVITGTGAVSPFGVGTGELVAGIFKGLSAVSPAPEFAELTGLRSHVKTAVPPLDDKVIPRKFRRAMSPMSVYATLAAREAWNQAGLPPDDHDLRTGVCIGSTLGSPITSEHLFDDYINRKSLEQMKSTLVFQVMGHSVASNVAQAMGLSGRTVAPSSACSTGCQAVGLAFEFIRMGREERMLAGGADELHPMTAATFDIINAASVGYNDRVTETPRPFDKNRDGIVCGEGAGVLLLESLESAQARGANILAEIVGFSTISDTTSIAHPNAAKMEECMREALLDAGVSAGEVGYVNAHATGTEQGDGAEAEAIRNLFGDGPLVSSLKGHLGHTMAASGALELIASVAMLLGDEIVPTRNLSEVDPACSGIRHAKEGDRAASGVVMKNSFAMGGINSCLVLRRWFYD